jgi:hypothetical protein
MLSRPTQIRIAIRQNLARRDKVAAMAIPYGTHCIEWGIQQLDVQLQTLLSLLKEIPNA